MFCRRFLHARTQYTQTERIEKSHAFIISRLHFTVDTICASVSGIDDETQRKFIAQQSNARQCSATNRKIHKIPKRRKSKKQNYHFVWFIAFVLWCAYSFMSREKKYVFYFAIVFSLLILGTDWNRKNRFEQIPFEWINRAFKSAHFSLFLCVLCLDFDVWRRIPAVQHAYSAVFFSLLFIAGAAADALCSLWQNGGQLNMICRNKEKEKRPAAFDQTEPSHCLVFVITCPWLCGCSFTPQNVDRSKWNHLEEEKYGRENEHLMLFFLLIVAEAKRCEREIAFWLMCVCVLLVLVLRFSAYTFNENEQMQNHDLDVKSTF